MVVLSLVGPCVEDLPPTGNCDMGACGTEPLSLWQHCFIAVDNNYLPECFSDSKISIFHVVMLGGISYY